MRLTLAPLPVARFLPLLPVLLGLAVSNPSTAAPPPAPPALSPTGTKFAATYTDLLAKLRAELVQALPVVPAEKHRALQQVASAVRTATEQVKTHQKPLEELKTAQALVAHAKGKWIGGAEQGIAKAEAALSKATTDAEREAATKDRAKWQENKAAGLQALKEREAALEKAKANAASAQMALQTTEAALTQARREEAAMTSALLTELAPVLSNTKLDATLVKFAVLTHATPRGLAAFAEKGAESAALVEKLLADVPLMQSMLVADGAAFGKYGEAMHIYSTLQQTSPQARTNPVLQRLALATALAHAQPIKQSNPSERSDAPQVVDPVKRYLHYEKAFLGDELDPAFKTFSVWEYRMVVDCDAPDEILTWGREMLKTYRPDHIRTADYGWRYVASVKTEVAYGSQNVKDDLPSLHQYQNIPKNGGVCGRRAFFGRFILQSFGIPVWGVTQHKHAAVGHWTPKGWVVNLGAGFEHSWWDKGEVTQSGTDFLLESQARVHEADYLKVLRAQWLSQALGEQAYNDRQHRDGGFWSRIGHFQALALAAKAVTLEPLGRELAEANAPAERGDVRTVTASTETVSVSAQGVITIPATAMTKPTGPVTAMKSFSGGMQLHARGGFQADYGFDVPHAGKYRLTAKVATLQAGQSFRFAANGAAALELAVPHTVGLWQQTPSVEIVLKQGRNGLAVGLRDGSRGVTIKEFTLEPVK
jgi:hypothetical protein